MNNFTQLIRLGRDAETRYSADGKPVTSFSGAYDTGYGERKKTTWIECVSFQERHGKLELKKGALIVINGELYSDKYADKAGVEKQTTKCTIADFQFAGPKQDSQAARDTGTAEKEFEEDSRIPF